MQNHKPYPEISLIATYPKGVDFDPDYLMELSSLLDHEELSHEWVLVFAEQSKGAWQASETFGTNRANILSLKVSHSNGLHALQLAGLLRANGRICVSLNPYISYDPHSLLSLLFVADKSNCELVYGCRKRPLNMGWALHRMLFVPLSFFAALPPYISSYRVVKQEALRPLKVKTPYYFHLDQLLKNGVENHSYLDFPARDKASFSDGYLYDIKHLFVAGVLLESACFLLIVADIYLLVQGRLLWALGIGLISLLNLSLLYLLKWRRRIAFKLISKRPA